MVCVFIFLVLIMLNISLALSESVPIEERIVTSLELLYGNQGVSVKYYYNETTNLNQLTSVPGCPKSIEKIPWLYYGDPPRCFLAGQYGPCPLGQKLLIMEGSPFGVCACECVVDGEHESELDLDGHSKPRYIFCKSKAEDASFYGQIYDTKENVCYERVTQGPCKEGDLLVGYKPYELECLPVCLLENGIQGVLNGTICGWIPGYGSYGPPTNMEQNECLRNEKYSEVLKKCIKRKIFVLS